MKYFDLNFRNDTDNSMNNTNNFILYEWGGGGSWAGRKDTNSDCYRCFPLAVLVA